jgi:recombination protein RecT
MPPVTQAVSNTSKAVSAKQNIHTLLTSDKVKKDLAMALPKHIATDFMLRVLFTSLNKTPKLLECSPESILQCIMDCAQMGLVPDNRNAYLIPFEDRKNKRVTCTLIPGYQGLVELAYNHPKVKSIRWNVVHEKDHFHYVDGMDVKLEFRPTDEEEPGALTHAFAIAEMEGGAKAWVVLNRRDVMKAKSSSRGASSSYSPWSTHEDAMWAKTAVRALCKRIPRSSELAKVLDRDDEETDFANPTFLDNGAAGLLGSINPSQIPMKEAKSIAPVEPPPSNPEDEIPMGPTPMREVTPAPAEPAPAPTQQHHDVETLRIQLQTSSIPEAKLLAWGADPKRRFWSKAIKSLDEIANANPDKITFLLTEFAKIAEELCQ